MLKFAVLCFLVIMASTSAEQCGDQVCGAGTCCAEYPEMHCKRGPISDVLHKLHIIRILHDLSRQNQSKQK
uniref:U25-Hexatoxin-Hc1l_1 n=1 Tax=Hadronyche cerberea TaxID=1107879 RepID=A0A4Q8K301_HADCE